MRVFFFVGICIVGFVFPFWVFMVFGAWYMFAYRAYELLFLGAIIDAQYGTGALGLSFPCVYTVALALMMFLIEEVKPNLAGRFSTPR